MKRAFLLLALLAPLFFAAACHKQSATPKITQAWVRLSPVSGPPSGGYFTISGGTKAARLVRIESALTSRIEMHESMAGGHMGMMTMKPLDGVDVPAGGTITFAPGGKHAMLYNVESTIKPGTAIPLRFGFADGTTAEAEAKTVAAGDSAPY